MEKASNSGAKQEALHGKAKISHSGSFSGNEII